MLTDEGFDDDLGCCATVLRDAGGCLERKRISTTPTGANANEVEDDLSVPECDSSGDMGDGDRPELEWVMALA